MTKEQQEELEYQMRQLYPVGPPNAYDVELSMQEREAYDIANYNRIDQAENAKALGTDVQSLFGDSGISNITNFQQIGSDGVITSKEKYSYDNGDSKETISKKGSEVFDGNEMNGSSIAGMHDYTNSDAEKFIPNDETTHMMPNGDLMPGATHGAGDSSDTLTDEEFETGKNAFINMLTYKPPEESSSKGVFTIGDDGNFALNEDSGKFKTTEIKITKVTPADFDKDGNLIKFPVVKYEDGSEIESATGIDLTTATTNLKNNNGEAEPGSQEDMVAAIAEDSEHNTVEALEILQKELAEHKFSPELMAAAYEEFLKEAGYIENVDERLYKAIIGAAGAAMMGADIGDAIAYGFGAQEKARQIEMAEKQVKSEQLFDILKEYGAYMDDEAWNGALETLGLSPDDSMVGHLSLGRDAMRKDNNSQASSAYTDKLHKVKKDLFEKIYQERTAGGEPGNLLSAVEFNHMFDAVAKQFSDSGNPEGIFEAEGQLLEAYGQWERYQSNYKKDKENREKSFLKFWHWDIFNDEVPNITTPMVFYEGLSGLIDGGGANILPLDPKKEDYALATMALSYLKGMVPGYEENQKTQMEIFNTWSKTTKGVSGADYNTLAEYPKYFASQVYKMLDARNKEMLAK